MQPKVIAETPGGMSSHMSFVQGDGARLSVTSRYTQGSFMREVGTPMTMHSFQPEPICILKIELDGENV